MPEETYFVSLMSFFGSRNRLAIDISFRFRSLAFRRRKRAQERRATFLDLDTPIGKRKQPKKDGTKSGHKIRNLILYASTNQSTAQLDSELRRRA